MKTSLAILAFAAALLGASGARADHGPLPGASYEVRENYDQQHYAGQGWLRGQPRAGAPLVREPAGSAKAQATKPQRRDAPHVTSGHGDW